MSESSRRYVGRSKEPQQLLGYWQVELATFLPQRTHPQRCNTDERYGDTLRNERQPDLMKSIGTWSPNRGRHLELLRNDGAVNAYLRRRTNQQRYQWTSNIL